MVVYRVKEKIDIDIHENPGGLTSKALSMNPGGLTIEIVRGFFRILNISSRKGWALVLRTDFALEGGPRARVVSV